MTDGKARLATPPTKGYRGGRRASKKRHRTKKIYNFDWDGIRDVGRILRHGRENFYNDGKPISTEDLEKATGVNMGTINSMEHGTLAQFSLEALFSLVSYLGPMREDGRPWTVDELLHKCVYLNPDKGDPVPTALRRREFGESYYEHGEVVYVGPFVIDMYKVGPPIEGKIKDNGKTVSALFKSLNLFDEAKDRKPECFRVELINTSGEKVGKAITAGFSQDELIEHYRGLDAMVFPLMQAIVDPYEEFQGVR